MSNRDRVRAAINAPVDAANKTRNELSQSDLETRLLTAIDGWGRGLAAGLEELGIALDELRRLTLDSTRVASAEPALQPAQDAPATEHASGEVGEEPSSQMESDASLEQLQARAAASREETRSLRDQASDAT